MGVIRQAVQMNTLIPATAPALLYLPPSMAVANLPPCREKEYEAIHAAKP